MSMINKLIKERERERDTHIGKPARYRASRRYGRRGAALRCWTAEEGSQGTGEGLAASWWSRARRKGLELPLAWTCARQCNIPIY